jgi:non-specific serine/threonine protein kinase
MTGKTISHFKTLEKLGEGGMGVVYKAEDTKLKRTVALKFLPPHLTKNETGLARFLQEAQAAAALNHPNVCTIHEIHNEGESPFIVMEYVEGKTLKDLVGAVREPPLQTQDIIHYATQIAEALKAAHTKGIIHRDIKSENIMVTDTGQVKVMDFGLAKVRGIAKLTKTGTTVGTFAYMAPEQFQKTDVDHRTDIWSFGVVLFEMLTGQLPFEGDYEAAIMYSVLSEPPKSLPSMNNAPENIQKVVKKALEKNPADRWQTAQEILNELRQPNREPFGSERKDRSIIVLPFDDMSPGRDNEYFSDGLTEEIITDLSHIHDLLVISRNSAMTFKGTKKKTKEIAKDVNVRYVLEGSVRKAGNNLRITAQLIDAGTDAHLWAEKYSGTLDDIFDIQEKVSRSIVDGLKLTMSINEKLSITERPIESAQVYEYYLKAKHQIDTFTEVGLDRAIQYLETGREIIGENALLYAGFAYAYWQYYNIGKPREYLDQGLRYARKSLELDPESSEGHFITGALYFFTGNPGDIRKIIFHFKRALALNPNNCEALFHLEVVYNYMGKTTDTAPLVERHLSIDPLSFYGYLMKAKMYLFGGEIDLALEFATKAYQLAQGVTPVQFIYSIVLAYNKCLNDAFAVIDQSYKTHPDNIFSQLGVFLKYALQRKKAEAIQLINPQMLDWCKRDFTNPWILVCGFSLINEKEEALNWLEKWVQLGCVNYPFFMIDPFLENIRGDERFKKLMKRVKHEWENFEV